MESKKQTYVMVGLSALVLASTAYIVYKVRQSSREEPERVTKAAITLENGAVYTG